jgi:hypothetical protein
MAVWQNGGDRISIDLQFPVQLQSRATRSITKIICKFSFTFLNKRQRRADGSPISTTSPSRCRYVQLNEISYNHIILIN